MALGNKIGAKFDKYAERGIFQPAIGSFIVEVDIKAVNHFLNCPTFALLQLPKTNQSSNGMANP